MVGKWIGEYHYNQKHYPNLTPVEFTIEILKNEDGKFQGTVSDNVEMGGTPGTGTIDGKLIGDHVYFEKKMPIRAMVTEKGEHVINENQKHPTIFYTGKLVEGTVSGEWKFKKKCMWIGLFPWWYHFGIGTFSMKKVN